MEKQRPKPADLLTRAKEEERELEREEKGRLKIFFGAAPGVGKTFAMLSEALEKRAEGLDIVIGLVETHGRKETEALLENMEVIPRCSIEYRGKLFYEFDIDKAIKRHPALILVDEMAHTNAVGMRHTKRWQDIKELLDRGIDVYTTLNVQHVESLNDVIKQITGVAVRETVPDSVVYLADSIELIDLPPEDLLERLEEGKVYIPQQAELAIQHFFRKANLTALRELALRFTAQRVNVQVESHRRSLVEEKTWPTHERLLVCVDHKIFSEKLIRTTRRLATSFHADWIAVYVDAPTLNLTETQRQNAIENLRFAESLGAKTQILSGFDIVKEILDFARINNVTKIVMGKEVRPRWKESLFRNLANELIRASREIDVYIVTGERDEFKTETKTTNKKIYHLLQYSYFASIVVVTACTLINFFLDSFFGPANLVAVYLLGIAIVAAAGQRGPAFLASILSVFAYGYFFVPMPFTKAADTQYLVTLGIMLLISQIISQLTIFVKKQNQIIGVNARKASILYRLSTELASKRGINNLLKTGVMHIAEVFESNVLALVPDASGQLAVQCSSNKELSELNTKERSIAQWAYDLGERTGLGSQTLPFTSALYLPLQGTSGKFGVLRIEPNKVENLSTPEQMHLLETFIQQMVLAMEVDKLQEEARKDELIVEAEGLRNMLLIMTTHEIQVPLSAIKKTLNRLIKALDEKEEVTDIKAFVETIRTESEQLNHIAAELIQALKLEAGTIKLRKEYQSIEVIINGAEEKIKKHYDVLITTAIPKNLPAIACDFVLLEQACINLLEAAIQHRKEEPLKITVTQYETELEVLIGNGADGQVIDDIELIFEELYQGKVSPKITELRLGLSISRSIIQLHGGKLWINQMAKPIVSFKFTLPV